MPNNNLVGNVGDLNLLEYSFRQNIYAMQEQKVSKLAQTPAIVFKKFQGFSERIIRGGTLELEKDNSVNRKADYKTFSDFDARWTSYQKFKTDIIIDKRNALDFVVDPTSFIYEKIGYAIERLTDIVCYQALIGEVLVGSERGTAVLKTAAQDGVRELDFTQTGLGMEQFLRIGKNFENAELYEDASVITLVTTANEKTNLLTDDRFINSLYQGTTGGPIAPFGQPLVTFPGSDLAEDGVGRILKPIVREVGTTRYNIAACKNSAEVAIKYLHIEYRDSLETYPESKGINVSIGIGGTRLQGEKVQVFKTDITGDIKSYGMPVFQTKPAPIA
jgi:hypothetical protein